MAPGEKLEVNGNLRIASGNQLQLLGPAEIIKFDAPTLGPAPGMLLTAHPTRNFLFGTYDGTTYSGTRMIINGGGNVGIGTLGPNQPLHVMGTNQLARFQSTAASALIHFTPSGQKEWRIGGGGGNLGEFFILQKK